MPNLLQDYDPKKLIPSKNSPLFIFDKTELAPNSHIAELIWLDKIIPVSLAENESCELVLEQDKLFVIAATKGSLFLQSAVIHGKLFRGQSVFLPSCDGKCCFIAQEPSECVIVLLSGDLPGKVLGDYFIQQKIFCSAGLSDILETVHTLKATDNSQEQISLAAYKLLMRLHETGKPYEKTSRYPLLVDTAMGIMREEFTHIYGVDEVAERLGITTGHFTRLFSQTVGIPPGRFLKLQKISCAKKLLTQPEMTVSLVAEMIGFSDVNYFSKVFRKEIGMSPSMYKKLHMTAPLEDNAVKNMIDILYL